MKIFALFIFIYLLFTGCGYNPEDNYKSNIVGVWEFKNNSTHVKSHVYEEFFPDGTVYWDGVFIRPKSTLSVKWEGVWTIDKNKLTFKVTKSNLPNRLCVGSTWTETIISINESEFIVNEFDGTKNTLKRIR